MARVTRILCQVITENVSGAGTDGDVYLGFGGREFHLDKPGGILDILGFGDEDFDRGTAFNYILGDGANVDAGANNDPRHGYLLDTATLDDFPVYIRFEPQSRGDNWKVSWTTVIAHDGTPPEVAAAYLSAPIESQGLWMGAHSGKVMHLRKFTGLGIPRELLADVQRARSQALNK